MISTHKTTLENKLRQVSAELNNRDGLAIEATPELMDLIQGAQDRELTIERINRLTQTGQAIREALSRVEEGTYGICADCDEDISPKRLQALPWATLCVKCQERHESRQRNEEMPEMDWAAAA